MIKEHEGKQYFKKIMSIESLMMLRFWLEEDYLLPNKFTWKNVAILRTYVIKDDNKFYPKLF